jgi:hypothetical protein
VGIRLGESINMPWSAIIKGGFAPADVGATKR